MKACVCGSGVAEKDCCLPLLRGGDAKDPVALMRSRYTAFATGDVAYLWKTLDDDHPDRERPRDDVLRDLKQTCRQVRFLGLRVLDHEPEDASGFARVLFSVRAFEKGRDRSFHEMSRFRRHAAGWRYVDGDMQNGAAPDGLTIEELRRRTSRHRE